MRRAALNTKEACAVLVNKNDERQICAQLHKNRGCQRGKRRMCLVSLQLRSLGHFSVGVVAVTATEQVSEIAQIL